MKFELFYHRRPLRIGLAMVISYLLAGAAVVLYIKWPHYEGHSHVPFSDFPAFFVWSPVVPYAILSDLLAAPPKSLDACVLFSVVFCALLWCSIRLFQPSVAAKRR
jgi:hypothetical protein